MAENDPERWVQVYLAALEQAPAARAALLDRECAGDPALRARVERLLARGAELEQFLEEPATFTARESDGPDAADDDRLVGTRVGRYRILRLVGMGGMGVVYEAEQDAPHRKVALKLLRPGWVSASLLKRFEHEAEVLGRLHHAGIAQIFEAGIHRSETGATCPFFAMELVHGRPLTEYAEQAGLGTPQRLELFARICDAVQHAHQHGVIHRDLKPGNILVEEGTEARRHEGTKASAGVSPAGVAAGAPAGRRREDGILALPKILDFGVARVTDGDIALTTMRTDVGQLIGTIAYMSPEQARGDSRELDTRADVYALGVILYELLTGRLPHDVTHKPIPEAVRVITQDDPTPISSIVDSAGRPLRRLRGDIATIVTRALEKEKGRRYPSAAELAADIRRYLGDEPILARPVSTFYQLRKFARRNRGLVGGVVAAFVVLVAGLTVSVAQTVRARRAEVAAEKERDAAQRQARRAEAVNEFLGLLLRARGYHPQFAIIGQVLDDAVARREPSYFDGGEIESDVRLAIGQCYACVARFKDAEEHLRKALEMRERLSGPDAPETLRAAYIVAGHMADTYDDTGEWRGLAQRAVNGLSRQRGDLDLETLKAKHALAVTYAVGGRWADLERLTDKLLPAVQQRLGPHNGRTLNTACLRFNALFCLGRLDEAETLVREYLDLCPTGAASDDQEGTLREQLGMIVLKRGNAAEAERIFADALNWGEQRGGSPCIVAQMKLWLGQAIGAQEGRAEEAMQFAREGLHTYRKSFGEESRLTRWAEAHIAETLWSLGRLDELEKLHRETVDLRREALGAEHDATLSAMNDLALFLYQQGRFAEGEPVARRAVEGYRRTAQAPSPSMPYTLDTLACIWLAQGRAEEALALFEEITQLCRAQPETLQPPNAEMRLHHGQCLLALGRYAGAERELLESDRLLVSSPDRAETVRRPLTAALIELYDAWGKPDQAAAWRAKLPATQPAETQP